MKKTHVLWISLLCIALSVIASIFTVAVFRQRCQDENAAMASINVYARVRSSGTIRAAYAVGAPLFLIDARTGAKSGIFFDIVNSAASHLGLKVEWTEETSYGQMIEGLKDNRYDLVGSGVWTNSQRAAGADFTIPVYFDAVYAYCRAHDVRFDAGITGLNSSQYVISTMDGELGATIAKESFPSAQTLSLPQNADFSQLILDVVNKKADVVFLAAAPAASYSAANPGKIRIINPNIPVRIFPNAIMLPQNQYSLRQALNFALEEMQSDGEIDTILQKYAKQSGVFLRVAPPFQSSQFSKVQ